VHTLYPRRVDEDLEPGTGKREKRHQRGIELERQLRLGLPFWRTLKVVSSDHGADDRQTVTQNAVLIEAGDVIDRSLDLAPEPVSRREVVAVGVKPRTEKLDEQPRHSRIAGQRLLQVAVTKRCAGLAQIFQERAQQRDFATGQTGS